MLATIGDDKVTLADVKARAGSQLDQLETQYQKAKSRTVRQLSRRFSVSGCSMRRQHRQSKSVEELVAAEAGGSLEPSEIEVRSWFAANGDRTAGAL